MTTATIRTMPVTSRTDAATTVRTAPVAAPEAITSLPLATVGTVHLQAMRRAARAFGAELRETRLGRGLHEIVAVGTPEQVADLARTVSVYTDDWNGRDVPGSTQRGLFERILERISKRAKR